MLSLYALQSVIRVRLVYVGLGFMLLSIDDGGGQWRLSKILYQQNDTECQGGKNCVILMKIAGVCYPK